MAQVLSSTKTTSFICSKWFSSLILVLVCSLLVFRVAAIGGKKRPYHDLDIELDYDQEEGGSQKAQDGTSFDSMKPQLDYSRDPKRVDPVVYDQAGCQSGWAYALTGQLEGQEQPAGLLKGGRVEPKSKQQLIDCVVHNSRPDFYQAARYLMDYGIEPASSGANVTKNGPCSRSCKKSFGCSTYKLENVALAREEEVLINGKHGDLIERALRAYGPLAVLVSEWAPEWDDLGTAELPCSRDSFANRKSEVFHAILLVGFGVNADGVKYFKFKNSRGPKWGHRGYGYIWRNGGQECPYELAGSFVLLRLKPCEHQNRRAGQQNSRPKAKFHSIDGFQIETQ